MSHSHCPSTEQTAPADRPPIPPVLVRIGITGHRPKNLEQDTRSLVETLGFTLRQIKEEVEAVCAAGPAPVRARLQLISSLAEGVDRMAAHCALDLGYELQVPLPFPREEYAEDFCSEASVAEFHTLLGRANAVFELEARPQHRDFAYRAAGHIVLRQCDLLLAVWDGQPSRGIGGTSELIDVAEEMGKPILYIDSCAPNTVSFRDRPDAIAALREHLRGELGEARVLSSEIAARYRAETWPTRISSTSHTLLRLLGERRLSRASAPSLTAATELESPVLARYFRWADALAIRHGEQSRSVSMRMQLLALGAVLSAILILPFEEHRLWVQTFSLCEVTCIVSLLLEALRSSRSDWHARWLVYRSLSERLRCLDFLGPLTETLPTPLHRGFMGHPNDMQEFGTSFIAAVTREFGLVSAQVDEEFLRRRTDALALVIRSQARFQHKVAHRYEAVEKALQRAGILLFLTAVALCVLDLVRALVPELAEHMNAAGASGVQIATAAAIVPALGAALAGLAAQGEYKRLSSRAEAMSTTLETLLAQLESYPLPGLRTLQTISAQLADVLTSEVQDWQVLVAAKPPTLPT